jgi:hypothetical protein
MRGLAAALAVACSIAPPALTGQQQIPAPTIFEMYPAAAPALDAP